MQNHPMPNRAALSGTAPVDEPALALDADRKTVRVGELEVPLTISQYRLLETMMASEGKAFSREELLGLLDPQGDADCSDRAIDIHMSRLRSKIEKDPRQPRHLLTVRGLGYRYEI